MGFSESAKGPGRDLFLGRRIEQPAG
jgi:hypothetical protein